MDAHSRVQAKINGENKETMFRGIHVDGQVEVTARVMVRGLAIWLGLGLKKGVGEGYDDGQV